DPLRSRGGGALQIRSCGPVVTPRANRGGNGGDASSPPLFRRCGRVVTPRANRGGNGGGVSSPPFLIILSAAALTHVVISGLATGSIYALMALALVIVYNATRTLNFAQGEMLMVSAFLAWTAQRTLGLSCWASIVLAIAGGALLGFVVEYAIVRRSPTATPGDVLIITLGLSLVLRARVWAGRCGRWPRTHERHASWA